MVIVRKDRKTNTSNGSASKPVARDPEKQYEFEVRLICGSRPMNKALKRTRFAMRTIDDLVVIVDGVTIFS